METHVIWWVGTSLLAGILVRGALTGHVSRYPLFYSYIGCVLLKEIVGLLSFQFAPELYEPLYWPTELMTIVASYAVVVEIFRKSLRHNPGIARKAQRLLLSAFGLTVSFAATGLLQERFVNGYRVIAEVGRDLRYIEGALLVVMLWLFARYRILLGPNLLGVIIGYSFWVGVNIVNLAIFFLPSKEFLYLSRKLIPVTYVLTLAIWCIALWSSQPEPVPPTERAIERDYDLLAAKTRSVLARTSHRLTRVIRS